LARMIDIYEMLVQRRSESHRLNCRVNGPELSLPTLRGDDRYKRERIYVLIVALSLTWSIYHFMMISFVNVHTTAGGSPAGQDHLMQVLDAGSIMQVILSA
jgi:hypothetical protein